MSYTPTEWRTGDLITAEKLNNMEAGIVEAIENAVSVEPLSVNRNGQFSAPLGSAYSPISVLIPSQKGVYGPSNEIVIVDENGNTSLSSLIVDVEPVQAGSGTPSPSNIRQISARTEANIIVSPTQDQQDGDTYTVSLVNQSGGVYGGTLDVTNGTLTITHKLEVKTGLGDYNTGNVVKKSGTADTNSYYFNFDADIPATGSRYTGWSNIFAFSKLAQFHVDGIFFINNNQIRFNLENTDEFNTADKVNAWITGLYTNGTPLQFVVPLATPITQQLSPQQVSTLIGINNIWADCGDVTVGYQPAD